ncbi:MAG TPA: tetratricopeptide repeat protein, partial [Pyrinomonadaceae bacterium]|nr:tetratricopeptide repeat protein [Pyrinomonadaceae bacterium]
MTVTPLKHVGHFLILAVVVFGAAINGSDGWSCKAQTAAQRNESNEVARLISEGAAALERNDSGAAAKLFQQALSLSPKNPAAHTYLGVLADRAGSLTEA